MKKIEKTLESGTRASTKSTIKNLIATGLVVLFVAWAKPARAQDSKEQIEEKTKTEEIAKPAKTWIFMMEPIFSPTDKVWTVRFQWWWSVGPIDVWWFLDLSWTDLEEWISEAFWKITASKEIFKSTSLALEYTLLSEAPDLLRGWFIFVHKIKGWKLALKVFPVSDKWRQPFILWAAQKQIWKVNTSAFVWTDIKWKQFYWEVEASLPISKKVHILGQVRGGGKFDSKPKAGAYGWVRVVF
jgi:hypothetical protein